MGEAEMAGISQSSSRNSQYYSFGVVTVPSSGSMRESHGGLYGGPNASAREGGENDPIPSSALSQSGSRNSQYFLAIPTGSMREKAYANFYGFPYGSIREAGEIDSVYSSALASSRNSEYSFVTLPSASMREGFGSTNAAANPVVVRVEDYLPLTESRNGNFFTTVFHLLCSQIAFQILLLPVAFRALGWAGGIICLSLIFAWQLYTKWLLIDLHEAVPGIRHSRFLRLAIVAFGMKLGKVLGMFPVMYLSGGSCFVLIITAGGALDQFYKIMCGGGPSCESPSGTVWFLVFACTAIIIAQLPNLNSIAPVTTIGALTGIAYCTMLWILPVSHGRPAGVSHDPSQVLKPGMAGYAGVLNAIGLIMLAFRGHNVTVEIQGTLPSSQKHPARKTMWRGVIVSYIVTALCMYPLAISVYWAYGNTIPAGGGAISIYLEFYGRNYSKFVKGLMHLLLIVSSLCAFQIYAMPVFDNLEFLYFSKKQEPCTWWERILIRLFFFGVAFFIAAGFPFLPSLAVLVGAIAMPLTFVYPCFIWNSIKKPKPLSPIRFLNLGLGCLGVLLSVLIIVAAIWNLADKGLRANFFAA